MKRAFAFALFSSLLLSMLAGQLFVDLALANPLVEPNILVNSPQNKKIYYSTDVELIFVAPGYAGSTINFTSFSYSLDGEPIVAVDGNTTLSGLTYGSHSLIVYGKDTAGDTRVSQTAHFDVIFPTTWPRIAIVVAIGIGLCLGIVGIGLIIYINKRKR